MNNDSPVLKNAEQNWARTHSGNSVKIVVLVLVCALTLAALVTPWPELAILPGIGLLFAALVSRFQYFAYGVIVFLVPLGQIRTLPAPLDEIKIHWVLAFLLVMLIFFNDVHTNTLRRRLHSSLWPLLLLFLFVFVISTCFSPYPKTAMVEVFRTTLGFGLIGLTLIYANNRMMFERVLPSVIIWAVTLASILAAIGYFGNVSMFTPPGQGELLHGVGFTASANNLSLMICVAFPFLMHRTLHAERGKDQLLAATLLFINLVGLSTTLSRGGVFVLTFLSVMLLLEQKRWFHPEHVGLLIAGVAFVFTMTLILVPAYAPGYVDRLSRLGRPESDHALNRRSSYIKLAFKKFPQRPVIGWGPGTFRDLYAESDYASLFTPQEYAYEVRRRYAHNTYLEALVGAGVLGLGIFLLILWRAFRNFSEARSAFFDKGLDRLGGLAGIYRLAFTALILYFLVKSALDHKFFLLLLGMSQVALNLSHRTIEDLGEEVEESGEMGRSTAD